MQHLCEGRCSTVFGRCRPQRFPPTEGCVVTTVSRGVDEFVMQHKSGIAPPLTNEQVRMKVDDADVFSPQTIEPGASHPSGDPVAPHGPLTKDAKWNASEDGEIYALPDVHGSHALEHVVLERLKNQGLLRRRAQNTTPQDQRW
jgi:hypothetical protein